MLVATGTIISVFMLRLGLHLASRWSIAAAAFGVASGMSCVLVGLVPMNNLLPHVLVSFAFFYSGMAAVALFTEAIWLDRRGRLSKWLILPGVLTVCSFLALAAAPPLLGLTQIESLDPRRVPRVCTRADPTLGMVRFRDDRRVDAVGGDRIAAARQKTAEFEK